MAGLGVNIRQLYELQEVDVALDAKREDLKCAEALIGESDALKEARAALEQEQARLATLQREQREAEWQAEDLRARIKPLNDRLYGGTVHNLKELSGMQEELEHLRSRLRSVEDRVLDLMGQGEVCLAQVEAKRTALAETERQWKAEQSALEDSISRYRGELSTLEEKRRQQQGRVEAGSLSVYDNLRLKYSRAVAKVEQGMCQGCRIDLSMAEIQRARLAQELAFCSHCRRILYVS